MRSAKVLLSLAVGGGILCCSLCTADLGPPRDEDHSAKYALFRSMTRVHRLMVSAVMIQRMSNMPGFEMEMKLEQDGRGRVKLTTNYPLFLQGTVSLDDGVVWKSFDPKRRRVLMQPSPRIEQGNPFYQLALAEQNYSLTMAPSITIANCATVCVTAAPKAKELCQRRYYLDARTHFMLRLEVITPDGEKTTPIDTRAIAYVSSPPKMDLGDDEGARVESHRGPERVWPPSAANAKVGFTPVTPDRLPLGFIVKEIQMVGGESEKFIAVRITDGLVTATVYQWDKNRHSKRWPYDTKRGFREFKGVRMAIFGDLPKKALDTILAGFRK